MSSPTPSTPPSAALNWPPIARFIDREARLASWAERSGPLTLGLYEFVRFGVKQGWACLFGAAMLTLIIATRLWYPPHAVFARYDALVVGAVAIQVVLLSTRLERWDEALAILVFHVVSTIMEVFKTAVGSWTYPEASQRHHWAMVPITKLEAWFLLMIVSYTLVAFVTRPEPPLKQLKRR